MYKDPNIPKTGRSHPNLTSVTGKITKIKELKNKKS